MSKLTNKHKYKYSRNKTRKRKRQLKEVDNFYYFVNKNWFKTNVISKTTNIRSVFTILQDKVDKELHSVITTHILKENSPESKRFKNLYNSVLTFNNPLVEKQIYMYIEAINNYKKGIKIRNGLK